MEYPVLSPTCLEGPPVLTQHPGAPHGPCQPQQAPQHAAHEALQPQHVLRCCPLLQHPVETVVLSPVTEGLPPPVYCHGSRMDHVRRMELMMLQPLQVLPLDVQLLPSAHSVPAGSIL